MSRLIRVPNIDGIEGPTADVLRALKHNFEVLAGQTGDKGARAITFGEMKVADLDPQQSVAAAGAAPTKSEFDKAVDDLTALRERINYLLALLRGEDVGG